MRLYKDMSLRNKIMIPVCLVVLLVMGVTLLVLVSRFGDVAEDGAVRMGRQMAMRYGQAIRVQIGGAMDISRTLAQTLGGQKKHAEEPDRLLANDMIKAVMEGNPNFSDVWAAFEPNAWDGRDAEMVNTPGSDATGRYAPLWVAGDKEIITCSNMDGPSPGSDWYRIPVRQGKEFLSDPVVYDIGGRKMTLVTASVPVRGKSGIVGAAGLDLNMDQVADLTRAIRPYEPGTGF